MFDLGFSELLVIAVVALLVLGPERLPKAARFTGLWVRKARAQWYSVKSELENELADEDLKRSLAQARADLAEARSGLQRTGSNVRREFESMDPDAPQPTDAHAGNAAAAAAAGSLVDDDSTDGDEREGDRYAGADADDASRDGASHAGDPGRIDDQDPAAAGGLPGESGPARSAAAPEPQDDELPGASRYEDWLLNDTDVHAPSGDDADMEPDGDATAERGHGHDIETPRAPASRGPAAGR